MTSTQNIYNMVFRQLQNIFGLDKEEKTLLGNTINDAIERTLDCIHSYANGSDIGSINVLYGDHYVIFLYYLSNCIYHSNFKKSNCLSDKIYLLNKMLFGCDIWGDCPKTNKFMK